MIFLWYKLLQLKEDHIQKCRYLFLTNKTVFSFACCSISRKMFRKCWETLSTQNHTKLRNFQYWGPT